jgi:pterin-4a-carbinolamine dehydratase
VSGRPLAFINYRRDDSREWATLIVDSLQRQLGLDAVFVDTEAIRSGDEWPQKIELALEQATVLLAIIGPQWLAVHDDGWRRRIDLPEDWVRREIEHALGRGTPLISVLVSGAPPLRGESLPPTLVDLPNRQFIRLEDKADIRALVEILTEDFGFRAVNTELDYPTPVDRQPELPEAELAEALRRLQEWSRIERESSRGKRGIAVELERVYKFKTFSDAIHFMATTARYVRVTGHHPWWENQYKDVRVRLTTWDVGMRITWKDIRLAQYLDRQYREYVVSDRGHRPES